MTPIRMYPTNIQHTIVPFRYTSRGMPIMNTPDRKDASILTAPGMRGMLRPASRNSLRELCLSPLSAKNSPMSKEMSNMIEKTR